MGSREIITFQLGNYANFIGAHWWNIQESYFQYDPNNPSDINHDVMFREGKNLKGESTFTPRLIFVDKIENIVNLPILSETDFNSQNIDSSKSKAILLQEQNFPQKHEYIKDLEKFDKGQTVNFAEKDYKFDETIKTWSDYSRIKYHPKSRCSLPNSAKTDFFNGGHDLYKSIEEDFIDKIRTYMEECENLQGFQIIVDAVDGYGGLTDFILLHLKDEYSSKVIFTAPVIHNVFNKSTSWDEIKRSINILMTYQKLGENSCLLVPLGTNKSAWKDLGPPIHFPYIIYSPKNTYHTSAILASFLDTMTLKYRLREDYNYMNDFVSGLNNQNTKICAASLTLPFPMAPESYLLDTLENLDETVPIWSQLTPGCEIEDNNIFYQKIVFRGVPISRMRDHDISKAGSKAHSCTTVEELFDLYLSFRLTAISDVTAPKIPLKTVMPYPKIFSEHVTSDGDVDKKSIRRHNYQVQSCPVIAGIHNCKDVDNMLDSLHETVKVVNIKRFHHFLGSNMDVHEFKDCLEKILELKQSYK